MFVVTNPVLRGGIAAAILTLAAPAQLLPHQAVIVATDKLFVVDDSAAIIATATIPSAGTGARDVGVSSDGRTAFVTVSGRLDFFDLTTTPPTLQPPSVVLPGSPADVDLSCSPAGIAVIAGSSFTDRVLSVDLTTRSVVSDLTLSGSANAESVELSPDGTIALVTGLVTDTVRVLLVSPSGVLTDTGVDVASGVTVGPANVAFAPSGRLALIMSDHAVDVLLVNGAAVTLSGQIPLVGNPVAATVVPDGSTAYVLVNSSSGPVVAKLVIDSGDQLTDTGVRIPVPAGLFGGPLDYVQVSPDGRSLFVLSPGGFAPPRFVVIDTATDTVRSGPTSTPVTGLAFIAGIATLCNANQAPIAVAGPDQNVPCVSSSGATVTLDARASSDPDLDALTFQWSVPAGIALDDPQSPTPTGVFPLGIITATVTVTDGRGGVSADPVTITVFDAAPPSVVCTVDRSMLWPANHKMVDVVVTVEASDLCATPGQLALIRVEVSSSEPDDAAGSGDGDTTGDTSGVDGFVATVIVTPAFHLEAVSQRYAGTIPLRAERAGGGVGRSYTITASVVDPSGNVGTSSCVVVVPHDRRK